MSLRLLYRQLGNLVGLARELSTTEKSHPTSFVCFVRSVESSRQMSLPKLLRLETMIGKFIQPEGHPVGDGCTYFQNGRLTVSGHVQEVEIIVFPEAFC